MGRSDEELRETEEHHIAEHSQEAEIAPQPTAEVHEENLIEVPSILPEDVAKRILSEALKSFPIPGKK